MSLPAEIARLLGDRARSADTLGRSQAQVYAYGDLFLKTGPAGTLARAAALQAYFAEKQVLFRESSRGVDARAIKKTFFRRFIACGEAEAVGSGHCPAENPPLERYPRAFRPVPGVPVDAI